MDPEGKFSSTSDPIETDSAPSFELYPLILTFGPIKRWIFSVPNYRPLPPTFHPLYTLIRLNPFEIHCLVDTRFTRLCNWRTPDPLQPDPQGRRWYIFSSQVMVVRHYNSSIQISVQLFYVEVPTVETRLERPSSAKYLLLTETTILQEGHFQQFQKGTLRPGV